MHFSFAVTCTLKQSNTVNFACYDSNNTETPCTNKMGDGKTIYFTCKEGHARVDGNFGAITCRGGQWDKPIPKCISSKSIFYINLFSSIIANNEVQESLLKETDTLTIYFNIYG